MRVLAATTALSPLARLQVEHILPKKHGGSDDNGNLALACIHCNSHKGSNLTGIDPANGQIVRLFDPRKQAWNDHFVWEGTQILGMTPWGRTTVRVMNMNADEVVQCRIAVVELS